MNQKGQIFTLDFLISMVLVILALGLVIQFLELNEYNLQEQELRHELETVGNMAADLMVSSPEIVCELGYEDSGGNWRVISYLMNCFPRGVTDKKVKITKENLKLPAGYGCDVSFDPEHILELELNPLNETPCSANFYSNPDNATNKYSAERKAVSPAPIAVLYPPRVSKKNFGKQEYGDEITVTLTVWKEE